MNELKNKPKESRFFVVVSFVEPFKSKKTPLKSIKTNKIKWPTLSGRWECAHSHASAMQSSARASQFRFEKD